MYGWLVARLDINIFFYFYYCCCDHKIYKNKIKGVDHLAKKKKEVHKNYFGVIVIYKIKIKKRSESQEKERDKTEGSKKKNGKNHNNLTQKESDTKMAKLILLIAFLFVDCMNGKEFFLFSFLFKSKVMKLILRMKYMGYIRYIIDNHIHELNLKLNDKPYSSGFMRKLSSCQLLTSFWFMWWFSVWVFENRNDYIKKNVAGIYMWIEIMISGAFRYLPFNTGRFERIDESCGTKFNKWRLPFNLQFVDS